jgi:hypothetical protein
LFDCLFSVVAGEIVVVPHFFELTIALEGTVLDARYVLESEFPGVFDARLLTLSQKTSSFSIGHKYLSFTYVAYLKYILSAEF